MVSQWLTPLLSWWQGKVIFSETTLPNLDSLLCQGEWDDTSREALFGNSNIFFEPIRLKLERLQPGRWDDAFNQLEALLLSKLELNETQATLFKDDWRVYVHFLRAYLTPLSEPLPKLVIEDLWSESIENKTEHYAKIIKVLLKNLVNELQSTKDYQHLNELKTIQTVFDSLSRLSPVEPVHLTKNKANEVQESFSLAGFFKRFWQDFVHGFRRVFYLQVDLTEPDYVETMGKRWTLLCRYGLGEEATPAMKTPMSRCYEAQAKMHYHKYQTTLNKVVATTKEKESARLIQPLQISLAHLINWSESKAKAEVLLTKDKAIDLSAMDRVIKTAFREFSESAYAFRRSQEKAWRGKENYLFLVEQLDNALIELYHQLEEGQHAWLLAVETLYPRNRFYKDACGDFRAFHEAARPTQWINWVWHTIYNWNKTEGYLAFEMNTRFAGKKFESYDLTTCKTVSDFVVTEAEQPWEVLNHAQVRALPGQSPLTFKQAKAARFCWLKSQWGEIGQLLNEEIDAENEKDDLEELPLSISRPKPLNLSALVLKEAYFEWVRTKPNLTKVASGSGKECDELFAGKTNEHRKFIVRKVEKLAAQQIEQSKKEIEQSKKELEEANTTDTMRLKCWLLMLLQKAEKQLCKQAQVQDNSLVNTKIDKIINRVQQVFKEWSKEDIRKLVFEIINEEQQFASIRKGLKILEPVSAEVRVHPGLLPKFSLLAAPLPETDDCPPSLPTAEAFEVKIVESSPASL